MLVSEKGSLPNLKLGLSSVVVGDRVELLGVGMNIELDDADEADDGDARDDGPAEFGSGSPPHWAWAFCMTLLLSSRNMSESWSR